MEGQGEIKEEEIRTKAPAELGMKGFLAWKTLVFENCPALMRLITGEVYCLWIGFPCARDRCPKRVNEETLESEVRKYVPAT